MAVSTQDVFDFLESRLEQLEEQAQEAETETDGTKCLGLGATLVGSWVSAAANPVGFPIGMIGLGIYLFTVGLESRLTEGLYPIPFVRKRLSDILAGVGGAQVEESKVDLVEAFLGEKEVSEYRLLNRHFQTVVRYLGNSDDYLRVYAYLLNNWHQNGQLPMLPGSEPVGAGRYRDMESVDQTPMQRIMASVERLPARTYSLPAVSPAYAPAPAVDEELSYDRQFTVNNAFMPQFGAQQFNWADLKDNDRHPVIAVLSPMGGGKSRLIKYLCHHVLFDDVTDFDGVTMDVFGDPNEWPGFKIVADEPNMLQQMQKDVLSVATKKDDYRKGQRDFVPMVRVLEESRSVIPALKQINSKVVETWIRLFASVVRKLKGRVFFASTAMTADALGVTASERDSMTAIFPGNAGVAMALEDTRILGLGNAQSRQAKDDLQQALMTVERPALVFHCGKWYWAEIPELDESGNPVGHIAKKRPQPQSISAEAMAIHRWGLSKISFDARAVQQAKLPALDGLRSDGIKAAMAEIVTNRMGRWTNQGKWEITVF